MQIDTVVKNLNARRFHAEKFETNEQLAKAVLSIIGGKSVGIGGSASVRELGLYESLQQNGNTVYCHTYQADPAEKKAMRKAAMDADVYLCSANAITESGVIINTDGTGNRVAATIFGPSTVIIVAGVNKLAKDVESGIARMKRDCCPKNAKRLGHATPCAITGTCGECRSSARMCNVTALTEYPTRHVKDYYVLLSEEPLGW